MMAQLAGPGPGLHGLAVIFDEPAFNQRLFFPRPDTTPPPPQAQDFRVPVDGATLHVRLHGGEGVPLLLFHGNGEVVADYDAAAPAFSQAGARLAVTDFRGYGASTGTPTLRTILADAGSVLDALVQQVGRPVVVMGRSLGSQCAAQVYAHPAVCGLVWESGFVDLEALVERRGLRCPVFSEDVLAVFDARHKLRTGHAPALVLHGAVDQVIRPEEATWAAHALGPRVRSRVLIPRHGHNDVAFSPLYWRALAEFLSGVS